ncbi:MAG: FHA domain-containing protein [Pirellulales bacterium]|nr:FHA domain-containing protein [Pirellulales bacterium]
MDVRLRVVAGANDGQEVAIAGPKFFVGRAEDCHLRPKSEMVSRHHCALIVEGSTVALRDFGSKNGTFVNGERVGGEQVLSPGDEVSIGPLRFEIVIEHEVGGKKKPKVKDMQEAAMRTANSSEPDVDDVSQWLMGDAGGSDVLGGSTVHDQDLGMSDTRAIAADETGVGTRPPAETIADTDDVSLDDAVSEADSEETDEELPAKKEKKKSGWLSKLRGGDKQEAKKLPAANGPSAADTTEAAVDMLRKMTKKR